MNVRARSVAVVATVVLAIVRPPAVLAQASADGGSTPGVAGSLELLATENARRYLRPVTVGMGAALNSRWFRTARVHRPLEFDAGFVAMGSLVPSRAEAFEPILPDSIVYGGQVYRQPYGNGAGLSTPTAVGVGQGIRIEPQGDYREALLAAGRSPASASLPFPRGYDVPAVPMGLLQLRVGLPLASEVTVRGLPSMEFDSDLGRVKAFGAAVKHEFSHWLPAGFPLDLAVEGGIQSVDLGDYLSATARNVALIASRQLSVLTLFAAGGLENADVTIRYTVRNDNLPENQTTLQIRDRRNRSARLTGGFSLDLFIVQLTAAYSTAAYDVVSAGITFGF